MTALAEPMIIGDQRPRLTSVPYACSFEQGQAAVEIAADNGLILDEWQSWGLVRSMGTREDGHWTSFEVCWILSRQNGKNAALEARQLAGLFDIGEGLQIHTAHEFKACAEHFRRIETTIKNNPALMRRVKPNGIRTSHGEEAIELRPLPTLIFGPGGTQVRRKIAPRLRFLARSRGSGRAFTCDALYYDEAMILSDDEVGASMPTMSAIPNPQMWYTGSAGMPDSVQLSRVRRRGIAGTDPSLAFFEWSCDFCGDLCPYKGAPECPNHDRRDDPRAWARANPGMNIRISQEHIEREFIKMPPADFDRERLGIGDWPKDDVTFAVIPESEWDACIWPDELGDFPRPPRIAIAVDITPDQSSSTICIAGLLPDDKDPTRKLQQLKPGEPSQRTCVLEYGNDGTWDDHRAGVNWIIPRLKEIVHRHGDKVCAIVIDRMGPGAEMINAVEKEHDLENLLEIPTLGDIAQAHAQFLRSITQRSMQHHDQTDLRMAVANATLRDVGDGQHAWARKNTTSDISPLCGGTMAVWAARKFGRGYDVLKSVF
jgi:hypothetical protein